MIITRKHIPRRTFLRGVGATVALPFLDAMRPALAATAVSPTRLAFFYVPNGIVMDAWSPRGEGGNFELARVMESFAPHRDELLILSGLSQRNGKPLGDGAGDHARASASYLTGAHARKTAGADIENGVSMDQIAAQKLGADTLLSSLELGCEDSSTVGNCDSGYSCAYTNSLAWRTPTTPMPPEVKPRMAFDRLFRAEDAGLDAGARARRAVYRTSILDLVAERTRSLTATLGPTDRRKLDEYLYAIREIEKRIEKAENDGPGAEPGMERPGGMPASFADYMQLMLDIQVAAFRADLTRVSTLMVAREGSAQTYSEIGVPEPHHPLTHHRDNPEWIEKITRINVFHAQAFARFIGRLAQTPDGDGSLLDHSIVVYGAGLSDGNRHSHDELPTAIFGRGGGLKPGRHIRYKGGTPLNNLFLSLLQRVGVEIRSFGDSSGTLDGLG
jgi:hypothetical protein